MLYLGEFASYAVLVVLELIKAGLVLRSMACLAEARDHYILSCPEGHVYHRWLHSSTHYYLMGYLSDYYSDNAREEEYKNFRFQAIRAVILMFLWALVQFGTSRVDACSWAKLGLNLVFVLSCGLLACFDGDLEKKYPKIMWRPYNRHRLLMTTWLFVWALCYMVVIIFLHPAATNEEDGRYSFIEPEVVSEETGMLSPIFIEGNPYVRLFLGAKNELRVSYYAEPGEPEKGDIVKLIEEPSGTAPYLVRREEIEHTRAYICRLPVVFTMKNEKSTTYEIHYTGELSLSYIPSTFVYR